MLKLGSLFDGAGGFPFAAQICGIEPVWASEIEAFPIAVTTKRFPNMKHLGDVSKINGAEIEPVDIITFGSPCQDLSVAGKRAGLDGERSGLFMQAIRIIKEMRSETNGRYPTIAVWENVPGAFSSAKGEDFRAVLEAFCQVVNENADVPRPANGKWSYAGEIVGDGYSVAWRVLDAQYWGVPQRRRRIFLVADFRGGRAGEILFEREGLSRNFAESRASWQGITKSIAFRADAEGRATYSLQANGIDRADTAGCNGCGRSDKVACNWDGGQTVPTLTARNAGGSQRMPDKDNFQAVLCVRDRAGARNGKERDFVLFAIGNGQTDQLELHEIPGALNCMHDQQAILVFQAAGDRDNPTISVSDKAFCIPANAMSDRGQAVLCVALDRAAYNQGQNAQFDPGIDESGKAFTVIAKGPGAVRYPINTMVATRGGADDGRTTFGVGDDGEAQFTLSSAHEHAVCYTVDMGGGKTGCGIHENQSPTLACTHGGEPVTVYLTPIEIILRRLTPTECARLQGMPDWWCDDVPHSDSAEYKMWGNGMALPCVLYVMEGVAKYLTEMEENDEHTERNA